VNVSKAPRDEVGAMPSNCDAYGCPPLFTMAPRTQPQTRPKHPPPEEMLDFLPRKSQTVTMRPTQP
jgi:hypothetical protein